MGRQWVCNGQRLRWEPKDGNRKRGRENAPYLVKALTKGRYRRACMCRCARYGGACPFCPTARCPCWQGGGGTLGHTMGRCLAQLLHAWLVLGGPAGGGHPRQGHTFVVL